MFCGVATVSQAEELFLRELPMSQGTPVTFLFAVTDFGTMPVLWASNHNTISDAIEYVSNDLRDIAPEISWPEDMGLYSYTGTITCENVGHPLDPPEMDLVWRGNWRKASIQEVAEYCGWSV